MGKKMFFWGGIVCLLVTLICFISSSAHATEYTVYTDSLIDTDVLDSVIVEQYSAPLSIDRADGTDGESAEMPVPAVSNTIYTVYDSGLPSSQYLDWASGLVKNVPFNQDYVFFRSGQYQYIFATGDYSSGFSAPSTVYVLHLAENYNGSYEFYSMSDSAFSLHVGQGLIYSSVTDYPSLLGADYSRSILFAFILFCWSLLALWLAKFAFESLFVARRL